MGCRSLVVQFLDCFKRKRRTQQRFLVNNSVVYIVKTKEQKMDTEFYT